MRCRSVYRSIFINGSVFSCHLSKNDTTYYDSCQNSELIKMKPLIRKPCIYFLKCLWIGTLKFMSEISNQFLLGDWCHYHMSLFLNLYQKVYQVPALSLFSRFDKFLRSEDVPCSFSSMALLSLSRIEKISLTPYPLSYILRLGIVEYRFGGGQASFKASEKR